MKIAATPNEGAKNQLDRPSGYIIKTERYTTIGPVNAIAL